MFGISHLKPNQSSSRVGIIVRILSMHPYQNPAVPKKISTKLKLDKILWGTSWLLWPDQEINGFLMAYRMFYQASKMPLIKSTMVRKLFKALPTPPSETLPLLSKPESSLIFKPLNKSSQTLTTWNNPFLITKPNVPHVTRPSSISKVLLFVLLATPPTLPEVSTVMVPSTSEPIFAWE